MKSQLVMYTLIFILIQIITLSSCSASSPSRPQREGQQKTADHSNPTGHRIRRSVISSSKNALEFNEDDDSSSPSIRVHIVKNEDLKKWRRSQGPDAILTRHPLAPSVLMLHHRYPRQVSSGGGAPRSSKKLGAKGRLTAGGGGGGGGVGALQITEKPSVVTPVLPINGEKKYNETGN